MGTKCLVLPFRASTAQFCHSQLAFLQEAPFKPFSVAKNSIAPREVKSYLASLSSAGVETAPSVASKPLKTRQILLTSPSAYQ
jgi:hypothetical protein